METEEKKGDEDGEAKAMAMKAKREVSRVRRSCVCVCVCVCVCCAVCCAVFLVFVLFFPPI